MRGALLHSPSHVSHELDEKRGGKKGKNRDSSLARGRASEKKFVMNSQRRELRARGRKICEGHADGKRGRGRVGGGGAEGAGR